MLYLNGHLGNVLAVVNSAAVNIDVMCLFLFIFKFSKLNLKFLFYPILNFFIILACVFLNCSFVWI